MATVTYQDAIKELFPTAVGLETLDRQSALFKRGKAAEGLFTYSVAALKLLPDAALSELGRHTWDVMHWRHVHAVIVGSIKTPTFAVLQKQKDDGSQQATILIPENWVKMATEEPVMAFGSVIFTGSQAVDFFNGRLRVESAERIAERARSYEATMLLGYPAAGLNEYQKATLEKYPRGCRTVGVVYSKPCKTLEGISQVVEPVAVAVWGRGARYVPRIQPRTSTANGQ